MCASIVATRMVAEDNGNCARSIVCPFHGWSHQLDGGLRGISSADKFPDMGRATAIPDDRRETRAMRYLNQRINREVTREDYQLARWSYEAMRSSVFPRNRLSKIEYEVASFQHSMPEATPVAGEETAPSSGRMQATNKVLFESRENGRAT